MSSAARQVQARPGLIGPMIEKLKRHPKRVVFTEGEDVRVLRVAARLVAEEAAAPILLGSRETIKRLAEEHGIPLDFVRLLEPAASSDFTLFCERFARIERYRELRVDNPAEIVARPHYFGALMVQYGQADALVGGNLALPAVLFRALIHSIKPMPGVPKMFGAAVMDGPELSNFGASGMLVLADCGLVPEPSVEELTSIALESGKLARHLLGRPVRVALLSHSTKGSATTQAASRVVAAATLARERAMREYLELEIDGELQADVALDPAAAEVKLPSTEARPPADVLVFPNLDAAHIAMKLLHHCAGAVPYGQLLLGLSRPAAQVPRTASEEMIFGTAAAVAVEAIKFHELHLEGEI